MATNNFQSDVGIKISQPFYDVKTAGDSQLIFNSSWPAMRIAKEVTFINSAYGGSTDFSTYEFTYTHNLGYVPFTMIYATDQATGKIIDQDSSGAIYVDFRLLTTASVKILCDPTFYDIHIVFYTLDITQSVEYPFFKQPTTSSQYNPDYGIKYAKQGKALSSTDMRDYILHSRCQGPQVLAVKASAPGDTSINYTSPTNYIAWVYGFYYTATFGWVPGTLSGQSAGAYFTSVGSSGAINFTMGIAAGDKASLVVLRDPLFSGTQLRITY